MSHDRLLLAIEGEAEDNENDIRFTQRTNNCSSWSSFTSMLRQSRFCEKSLLEKCLRNIVLVARKICKEENKINEVAMSITHELMQVKDSNFIMIQSICDNINVDSNKVTMNDLYAVFNEIKLLRKCPLYYSESKLTTPFGFDIPVEDRQTGYYQDISESDESSHNFPAVESNFDKEWLTSLLNPYSRDNFSTEGLYRLVLSILSSNDSTEEVQSHLFDLLGYDGFDSIIALISNRGDIIRHHTKPLKVKSKNKKTVSNFPCFPSISEIRQFITKNGYVKLPNVFDSNVYKQYDEFKLPTSTLHKNNEKFERFDVLPPNSTNVDLFDITNCKQIHIKDLDDMIRKAFEGVKSLNCIQSTVFEVAMNSQENMLITAPTGAGKTNIALLTILSQLKQDLEKYSIENIKIVYIAPMKALASEITAKLNERLAQFGLNVRELTGDMQLTKKEVSLTQVFVVTPEKLDVVSRKDVDIGMTDSSSILSKMSLLIIDELQLLADTRGSVLEALVARVLRLVESSQRMIRIVGLSATIPNYLDVASFLRVNLYTGLFVFDGRFRPVPLTQSLVGVKGHTHHIIERNMNEICYSEVIKFVMSGHQVMIFVTSRNGTIKTANCLLEMAQTKGQAGLFVPKPTPEMTSAIKQMQRSHMRELGRLFPSGFLFHHAGMSRSDRNSVERYFRAGLVSCLVCTATLAWGVNLPAHAVIIKGTSIYDSKTSSFVNMSVLDVLQIFGRAGRPQYDTTGFGVLITEHSPLPEYMKVIGSASPIESRFLENIEDNLNAEIVLGTVSNVPEAIKWLKYSYFYVRLLANPTAYGSSYSELLVDETLSQYCGQLVCKSATCLDNAKMIRFDELHSYFFSTDLGRTASHLYVTTHTIKIINNRINERIKQDDILSLIASATEFEQIKVRPEECDELETLEKCIPFKPVESVISKEGKVHVLLQSYICRFELEMFSLISDQQYIIQNGSRIARALFEITDRNSWALASLRLLNFCKSLDRQLWDFETPLKQFNELSPSIIGNIQRNKLDYFRIESMEPKEIGLIVRNVNSGGLIKRLNSQLPILDVEASIQPITRTIIRIRVKITANFIWDDKMYGVKSESSEMYQIWVTDPESDRIYHSETLSITKKHVTRRTCIEVVFVVPIFEPLPAQYFVDVISNRWVGVSTTCPVYLDRLLLPSQSYSHTELLDLQPLPLCALGDRKLESLYNFTHFNPIQTQVFHSVYHTDHNILLGAPTGSGKTNVAELAIFRVFREYPSMKCVYIAPLKALVRERLKDWKDRIEKILNKRVVELTGDCSPDAQTLQYADLIVTTPEKWDGISRSWQCRSYVRNVGLICIDEIHLLGEERGPVLEVVLSRLNFISNQTQQKVRIIGLSTALANAIDIATWLSIPKEGMFNFRPSVRPVPLEVHISGFPGKHYCPRMASMNRSCYRAIQVHSPNKPVLIFVSSRRQTRLTALALVSLLASESDDFKQWLHTSESEIENLNLTDNNLKLTLPFGVGIHHAGLVTSDRESTEKLFIQQKIQILVSTSTLAWGVNFPAHLVIVKGTEYFDGKTKCYVDFPVTDLLQMMGRAGRPQFDDCGVACIFVHDIKKIFYKKFLYDPFPVESNLVGVLPEHINAEIVAGTISNPQQAVEYLTWTYFYRRILSNPNYYNLDCVSEDNISIHLSNIIEHNIKSLISSRCIRISQNCYYPLPGGIIASYYYLNHQTIGLFVDTITDDMSFGDIISLLSAAKEFDEIPVRHNEDKLNCDLANELGVKVDDYDSPHTKTLLLIQSHLVRHKFSCVDYVTDCKSVLDQALRVMQSIIDWAAHKNYALTTIRAILLVQHIIQALVPHQSSLITIPFFDRFKHKTELFDNELPLLFDLRRRDLSKFNQFMSILSPRMMTRAIEFIERLPIIQVKIQVDRTPVIDGGVVLLSKRECTLIVKLWNINRLAHGLELFSPRVGKPKSPGWFILLTDMYSQSLLALKRVKFVRDTVSVVFSVPSANCSLYLFSDTFVGLDQQYDIFITVL